MINVSQYTNILLIKIKQWPTTTDLLTKYTTVQKCSLLTLIAFKFSSITNSAKLDQYYHRREVFYQKISLRGSAKVYDVKLTKLDNNTAIFLISNPKP